MRWTSRRLGLQKRVGCLSRQVRELILVQQQEIEQLRRQFTTLATELAQLRERMAWSCCRSIGFGRW